MHCKLKSVLQATGFRETLPRVQGGTRLAPSGPRVTSRAQARGDRTVISIGVSPLTTFSPWQPPVRAQRPGRLCAWFQRLKQKYDKLLSSSFAFDVNLRPCSTGSRKFAVTDENPASVWTMTLPAATDAGAALTAIKGQAVQVDPRLTKG